MFYLLTDVSTARINNVSTARINRGNNKQGRLKVPGNNENEVDI